MILQEKNKNISSSLYWSNLQQGTRSLVLLVSDYDAPSTFIKLLTNHWKVYNIKPYIEGLHEGITSDQFLNNSINLGINISGGTKYVGPNLPIGIHNYYFRIYTLSTPYLSLTKPKGQEVIEAMGDSILAYGELIGKF